MKIRTNIVIDGTIQHSDGGANNEVFTTDGGRITLPENGVVFVTDEANLPVTGVVDTLYIAKSENTIWEWNGASYDQIGDGGGTIVSSDANNAITAGGDGGAFLNTSSLGEANNVEFYTDVASLPATGVVDTLYIAKTENSIHEWNGSSYDSLGGSTDQNNIVRTYNIDSANLTTVDLAGVTSYVNTNGMTIDETEIFLIDVSEPANVEPTKTVSTSAPSGTPNDGDEWVIYIA